MTDTLRRFRVVIAAAAAGLLVGVSGCGPAAPGDASTPAPSATITTPAARATTVEVFAADRSIPFGTGVEVTFALTADGAALPAGSTASVSLGSAVVQRAVAIATDGTGSVALDAARLTPGPHVVTVVFPGDSVHAAAGGSTEVMVVAAASTVELTVSPLDTGAFSAVTAVRTSTGVPAVGSVAFTIDGSRVGEVPVADGVASMEVPVGLGVGDHQMDAVFTPAVAAEVSGAGTSAGLTVSKTSTTVMAVGGAGNVRYGDRSTFAVTVSATGVPADLTGAVTVAAGGTTVAEGTTDPAGRATLDFYNTADPGPRSYTVSYAGNDRVEAATADFTVETTRTDVDFSIDKPSLKPGESGTVRVTVIGTPTKPSGTATVTYDGAVIASGELDGDGRISAPLTAVAAGSHKIAVSYGGDVRFEADGASTTLTVKEPVVNPNADAAAAVNADNPCPVRAAACVDLARDKAWLQSAGQVTYGPVPITSGRSGYRTPAGTYAAYWFHKDHKSSIFNNAPMPNSVFFNGDIAFHQGSLSQQSHGCIHLSASASAMFFDTLSVGDVVYVWGSAPY